MTEKKASVLLWVILIISIIFISIVGVFFLSSSDEKINSNVETEKENKLDEGLDKIKTKVEGKVYTSELTKEDFIDVCNIRKKGVLRESCFQHAAESFGDKMLCEKTSSQSCVEHIDLYVKNDFSECENYENKNEKQKCYRYTSIYLSDKTGCENVLPFLRDSCIIGVLGKIGLLDGCDDLLQEEGDGGEELRSDCYAFIAKNRNDFEICEGLDSQSDVDSCYSIVLTYTRDINACNNIDNKELKANCEYIASQSTS